MAESTSETRRSYSGQIPMATRLEVAGMIDAKAGRAMAAPAAIPATPRNCLREQREFIIGATFEPIIFSMNSNSIEWQDNLPLKSSFKSRQPHGSRTFGVSHA
jgi:hypothetical protein